MCRSAGRSGIPSLSRRAAHYDGESHPGAVAWFKASARHLVERVDGYLEILAAHGVSCVVLRSDDPGRIIYEDDHQIVVVPEPRCS